MVPGSQEGIFPVFNSVRNRFNVEMLGNRTPTCSATLFFVQLFGTATNSNHHGGVAIIILSGHVFFGKIPMCLRNIPQSVFLLSSSVSVQRPSCARVVWLRSTVTSWINDLYWGRKQKGSPLDTTLNKCALQQSTSIKILITSNPFLSDFVKLYNS